MTENAKGLNDPADIVEAKPHPVPRMPKGVGRGRCKECKHPVSMHDEKGVCATCAAEEKGEKGDSKKEEIGEASIEASGFVSDLELAEAIDSMAKASRHKRGLEVKPGKADNWIERAGPGGHGGQLPAYIQHIALAVEKKGKPKSMAIAIAIGTVKRWAAGGGKVDANTRAAAAKALAEWEALKTKSHVKSAAKGIAEAGGVAVFKEVLHPRGRGGKFVDVLGKLGGDGEGTDKEKARKASQDATRRAKEIQARQERLYDEARKGTGVDWNPGPGERNAQLRAERHARTGVSQEDQYKAYDSGPGKPDVALHAALRGLHGRHLSSADLADVDARTDLNDAQKKAVRRKIGELMSVQDPRGGLHPVVPYDQQVKERRAAKAQGDASPGPTSDVEWNRDQWADAVADLMGRAKMGDADISRNRQIVSQQMTMARKQGNARGLADLLDMDAGYVQEQQRRKQAAKVESGKGGDTVRVGSGGKSLPMTKDAAKARAAEINAQVSVRDAVGEDAVKAKLPTMALSDLAREIRADWPNVNFAAKPYLDALDTLDKITDNYYYDSGTSVVAYFLSNATSWRGPKARLIKAELRKRLKRGR